MILYLFIHLFIFIRKEDLYDIPEDVSPLDDRKYLVFESCLKTLLMVCTVCLASCRVSVKHVKGTLVVMRAVCCNGHEKIWASQPLHKKMPLRNLLMAASMFFSGTSANKAILMLKNINCMTFGLRSFSNIQAAYLLSSVSNVWKKSQLKLVFNRKHKDLHIGGDARCCSPGHTAKYGSYSVMDLKTDEILDVQLIQVNMKFDIIFHK